MRAALAALTLLTGLCSSSSALAQEKDSDWDGGYGKRAERRSDFTFGVSAGLNMGVASGYPNEVEKIDEADYELDTGGAAGGGGALWIGVALADWLTFGLGATSLTLSKGDTQASTAGFIFRVETFPLFYEGGVWRDLGLSANVGLGTLKIEQDGREDADGGAMSLVSLGAFYEPWRFGSFAVGPILEYSHLFSLSGNVSSAVLGARLAFYGGP